MLKLMLILIATVTTLATTWAGDAEYTLKDGRKIVGIYDEQAEQLIMMGGKAKLHIAKEEVVSSRALDDAAGTSATAPEPAARVDLGDLVRAYDSASRAATVLDADDAARAALADARNKLNRAVRGQLMRLNLARVRIPESMSTYGQDRFLTLKLLNDEIDALAKEQIAAVRALEGMPVTRDSTGPLDATQYSIFTSVALYDLFAETRRTPRLLEANPLDQARQNIENTKQRQHDAAVARQRAREAAEHEQRRKDMAAEAKANAELIRARAAANAMDATAEERRAAADAIRDRTRNR